MGLVDGGYPRQRAVWMYKLDLDPAVQCRYPHGWRDFAPCSAALARGFMG